ncbi:MAG: glycoside hydrolase family 3 C-terminal domain-containing protein [Lachnospiraceae bacterium]|nr:glycoside hydrolase family 3 C-terminal domain-containing protein [Lachnospiraceae bacterium]
MAKVLYGYEKKHLRQVRKSAPECTLFLKKNGSFPLDEPCRIALYGSGARHTVKGGTGSGEVNSRFSINIERGLKNEGFEITTKAWLDRYDEIYDEAKVKFYEKLKRTAKEHHTLAVMESMGKVMPEPEYKIPLDGEGEVAVYVLSRISGEGSDREAVKGDILLSDTEVRDILEINEKYDRFMLVLNVGGPVDLSPVSEVSNILLLSQLGVVTGKTFAEILTGKYYPSGKLTTTWSSWRDYSQIGDFGGRDDTYYKEGIYVGYRFFDTMKKTPMFPFGFGLGYTDFSVDAGDVTIEKTEVSVYATVKNTGKHAGKEVVQVYVNVPDGRLDRPYQTLAGFVKTKELMPGGSQEVCVCFDVRDLAGYDRENARFILEKGDYVINIGNSSRDTKVAGVLEVDCDIITKEVYNCIGDSGAPDFKPFDKPSPEIPKNAKRIKLDADTVEKEHVSYDREYDIDAFVNEMDNETLAYMNVGAFNPYGGISGVIGDSGKDVAGAAGQTANPYGEEGFPTLVMADGPAGLRLSKLYVKNKKGVRPVGLGLPESFENLMPKPVMSFLKFKEKLPVKGEIYDQYATAIPIGTAVAQSFNIELAESLGDLVGDEMERFNVQLWLAPALNIHRDIRCGRNFEYFSEDPLVSGKFAAAITRGVQSHNGCGTTIKHYAANNQETNRYNSNSHVSERAMREIYLKGFEICVKESQPMAVMTSYNLLNNRHTSESRSIIEEILRCEFGYDGIVMTDWIVMGGTFDKSSKYRGPKASLIAAAGGDLVMPGCKDDVKDILKGIEKGVLTRKQLLINATRVYRMAKLCKKKAD